MAHLTPAPAASILMAVATNVGPPSALADIDFGMFSIQVPMLAGVLD
jgi:hypothetical protein